MPSEKERVYTELERVQHKCAKLKRELRNLRAAATAKENAILRREAQAYKKALSNIGHRLENGGVTEPDLRSIVEAALDLRGLKPWQRKQIRDLQEGDQ